MLVCSSLRGLPLRGRQCPHGAPGWATVFRYFPWSSEDLLPPRRKSMPRKKSKFAVLVGLLGIVVLSGACGAKKKPVAPPPPPPPPPPPAAPACTLTAEPSTVEKGQSVTLSWSSQNATDLDLQPGVGKVQAQGSSSVKPDDSTTYTMTATGPGGSNTCTARVTVTVPPPPPPPPPPPKGPS